MPPSGRRSDRWRRGAGWSAPASAATEPRSRPGPATISTCGKKCGSSKRWHVAPVAGFISSVIPSAGPSRWRRLSARLSTSPACRFSRPIHSHFFGRIRTRRSIGRPRWSANSSKPRSTAATQMRPVSSLLLGRRRDVCSNAAAGPELLPPNEILPLVPIERAMIGASNFIRADVAQLGFDRVRRPVAALVQECRSGRSETVRCRLGLRKAHATKSRIHRVLAQWSVG